MLNGREGLNRKLHGIDMAHHIVHSVHVFRSLLQLVSARKTPDISPSKEAAAFFNLKEIFY